MIYSYYEKLTGDEGREFCQKFNIITKKSINYKSLSIIEQNNHFLNILLQWCFDLNFFSRLSSNFLKKGSDLNFPYFKKFSESNLSHFWRNAL